MISFIFFGVMILAAIVLFFALMSRKALKEGKRVAEEMVRDEKKADGKVK